MIINKINIKRDIHIDKDDRKRDNEGMSEEGR